VSDVLVAEVSLDRTGVDTIVGQFVATGMPQHVGVLRQVAQCPDRDGCGLQRLADAIGS
jgi:hypothetical protein